MIKIQNIRKSFQTQDGEKQALKNVSFEFEDGNRPEDLYDVR